MKTLEEMTPDELRALADKKEKMNKDEPLKPVKTGKLKHDLYTVNPNDFFNLVATKKELSDFVCKGAELVLSAGETFLCYLVNGGVEEWADSDECYIEFETAEWAAANLIDIKDVKGE